MRIVGDVWKVKWPGEETKNGKAHEVMLLGEAREIVERAWSRRLPDRELLFHVNGKPLGPMRYELERTCKVLGIPYGRGKGIVFHDTRHSAVTNLVASRVPEPVAMTDHRARRLLRVPALRRAARRRASRCARTTGGLLETAARDYAATYAAPSCR